MIFGAFGLFSGSLWGRKAWGVWWQWDARLTMAFMLELVFLGYLLVRKYGGPGAEKLAAAMGIFGAATAPFIYKSVDWWRTIHPQTSVMRTLGEKFPGRVEPRLVLHRRVSAAVCRRAGRARAARSAARRARSTLSGCRGVTMVRRIHVCLVSLAAFGHDDRARAGVSTGRRAGTGFVPVTGVPSTEQIPAAPLVIGAYAFFLLLMMFYLWTIWRRIGKVETDMRALERRQAAAGAGLGSNVR